MLVASQQACVPPVNKPACCLALPCLLPFTTLLAAFFNPACCQSTSLLAANQQACMLPVNKPAAASQQTCCCQSTSLHAASQQACCCLSTTPGCCLSHPCMLPINLPVNHPWLAAPGESAVGAAHSLAVQLGLGEPHHVSHSDGPLHGARLALPLRLPSPGQCYTCSQG